MSRPLTSREVVLSWSVGSIVFAGLTWLVVSYFLQTHAQLRQDLSRKQLQVGVMQNLLANTALWEQREAWLRAHQPKLENEATAGVQLLNQVQELARKLSVGVEQPAIGNPERRPQYTAVAVTLETKSTWPALQQFLTQLQGTEQFIVIESANLRKDPQDTTQMRGHFRIAKWFAPKL